MTLEDSKVVIAFLDGDVIASVGRLVFFVSWDGFVNASLGRRAYVFVSSDGLVNASLGRRVFVFVDRSQAFTSVRAGHCYLLLVGFGRFIDDGPFRSRWSVCWLVIGLPEEVGNLRLGGELGLSFVLTRHLGIMGEVGGKKGKLGTKII